MKIYLTILFFILVNILSAQLRTTYSIGILSSGIKTSINTSPLTLSGKNCIVVNSGLSKFLVSNKGIFFNECIVNLNYIKLSIQVSPNPVHTFTVIKFREKVTSENNFIVTIVNELGTVINVKNVLQDQFLYEGYKLNFTDYPDGFYFINISSNKVFESFKILKY